MENSSDQLVASLYEDLRVIARREHFRAGSPQTLQATALINEAYIRLQRQHGWAGRSHFLGCAATAMRHVLIDAARARQTAKRNGLAHSFDEAIDTPGVGPQDDDVLRLGEALDLLARLDPNLAQVIDCRFFARMDERETADVMGVSDRTIRRWWVQARAFIHREMLAE